MPVGKSWSDWKTRWWWWWWQWTDCYPPPTRLISYFYEKHGGLSYSCVTWITSIYITNPQWEMAPIYPGACFVWSHPPAEQNNHYINWCAENPHKMFISKSSSESLHRLTREVFKIWMTDEVRVVTSVGLVVSSPNTIWVTIMSLHF